MFEQFISEYGTTIMYALLTTVAGIIGTWIGSIYKKYINDKTKEAVVRTVCKAIEQMYKDLHGEEKYTKAVESIVEMLSLKGITITELEIKMLIEATCSEFVKSAQDQIESGVIKEAEQMIEATEA